MSQQRLIDFGSTVEASKYKDAWSRMFAPSVFVGYDPTILVSMIPTAVVEFSPGAAIVPNGTIITDNTPITVSVPLGASAFESTIVYTHTDQKILGGVAAVAQLISGIQETWPDSVVLAWVDYPGGSIPLTDEHITLAPKAQVNPLALPTSAELESYLPPLSGMFGVATDANVTVANVWDAGDAQLFLEVSSTVFAVGVETAETVHQFTVNRPAAPRLLEVTFDAPTTDSIDVTFYDTDGVAFGPTTLTGTGASSEQVVDLTGAGAAVFEEGKLFVVNFIFNIDIASTLKLARLNINYRIFPF